MKKQILLITLLAGSICSVKPYPGNPSLQEVVTIFATVGAVVGTVVGAVTYNVADIRKGHPGRHYAAILPRAIAILAGAGIGAGVYGTVSALEYVTSEGPVPFVSLVPTAWLVAKSSHYINDRQRAHEEQLYEEDCRREAAKPENVARAALEREGAAEEEARRNRYDEDFSDDGV